MKHIWIKLLIAQVLTVSMAACKVQPASSNSTSMPATADSPTQQSIPTAAKNTNTPLVGTATETAGVPAQSTLDLAMIPSELLPVIDAILSGNSSQRAALVQFLTTACTKADGLGGPPKCESDQSEGTLVEVFPVGGSEGSFAAPENIDAAMQFDATQLVAVIRVTSTSAEEAYWPSGEYLLLVETDNNGYKIPLSVRVQGGKIVRLQYHPGSSAADVLSEVDPANVIVALGVYP